MILGVGVLPLFFRRVVGIMALCPTFFMHFSQCFHIFHLEGFLSSYMFDFVHVSEGSDFSPWRLLTL